ncbi:(2Fe-2S) ferredoxin domain-containing protein [Sphingomonas sp.]|uniref:(2Fe-2S) ferredoxin domain-containing protein n=1 Tax=Sphingomonas sp. TaxID=28214 RepID=UPI000DB62F2F|nr:(2Fe-2S) ferredoxin domain-containing protein [Sphingomonas sp.]PZU08621.1 MAG: hypothetical protein DI605_11745 [Sphingomonas sp.]
MRRSVPSKWAAAVIVCAKCEKKLGGGFGKDGKQRLSKLLAKRAGGGKGRKAALVGVITAKCMKLCPKRAVTVIDGAHPDEWLIVPGGTPVEEVEALLGLRAE